MRRRPQRPRRGLAPEREPSATAEPFGGDAFDVAVADEQNFGHVPRADYTRRNGIDQASHAPIPVNAAMVTKAARNASPISVWTTACRAGGRRGDRIRSVIDHRPEQACRSLGRRPQELRTNCGDRGGAERRSDRAGELHHGRAGAEHSLPGDGLHRDLDHAHDRAHETRRAAENPGQPDELKLRHPESEEQQAAVAARSPYDGNTAVRPVRVTNWPVTSEPMPMPNISGNSKSPVSAGDAPRTARSRAAGT